MPIPSSRGRLTVKLMLVVVACIGAYVNLWRVSRETIGQRASRDLATGDASARRRATVALGDTALEEGARVVPALASAVRRDADVEVRFLAATALGNLPGPNEEAAEALIAAMRDAEPRVRARAALSLGVMCALPRVPSVLLAALSDPAPEVRAEAAATLGRGGLGDAPGGMEALFEKTADPDGEVRAVAITALDAHSSAPRRPDTPETQRTAARFRKAIVRALRDDSFRVRRAAAHALEDIPWFGFDDCITLFRAEIAALADADPEVRASAAHALAVVMRTEEFYGARGWLDALAAAMPPLLKALSDADSRVRIQAGQAVCVCASRLTAADLVDQAPIRAALVAALESTVPEGRAEALGVLDAVVPWAGEDRHFVRDRLCIAAHDPDPLVRRAMVKALEWEINRWVSRQPLPRDWLSRARVLATRAIREMASARQIEEIFDGLRWITRAYLAGSRWDDPRRKREWAGLLEAAMTDPDAEVRRLAYPLLWTMDGLLGDADPSRRVLLRSRLDGFLADLGDPAPATRLVAAWGLGWVPVEDLDRAIAVLEGARKDGDPRVRNRAEDSLKLLRILASHRDRSEPWPPALYSFPRDLVR